MNTSEKTEAPTYGRLGFNVQEWFKGSLMFTKFV